MNFLSGLVAICLAFHRFGGDSGKNFSGLSSEGVKNKSCLGLSLST